MSVHLQLNTSSVFICVTQEELRAVGDSSPHEERRPPRPLIQKEGAVWHRLEGFRRLLRKLTVKWRAGYVTVLMARWHWPLYDTSQEPTLIQLKAFQRGKKEKMLVTVQALCDVWGGLWKIGWENVNEWDSWTQQLGLSLFDPTQGWKFWAFILIRHQIFAEH